MFRFLVQRASLRRFTTAVSKIDSSDETSEQTPHRLMRSSVVLHIGIKNYEHSFVSMVAQLSEIELPAFRVHDRATMEFFILDIKEALSMEAAVDTLLEMSREQSAVVNTGCVDTVPIGVCDATVVDADDAAVIHAVEGETASVEVDLCQATSFVKKSLSAIISVATVPIVLPIVGCW